MFYKIKKWLFSEKPSSEERFQVIGRDQHQVSRELISPNALKVLYRLKDAGYEAYLVGGGVRDILLSRQPKDFDIATGAHPEEIRRLFKNSRIIGRRFRLVHVFYKHETIEVSTFRANAQPDTRGLKNTEMTTMIQRDNTFGTIEEDAWRRDFTVNALYYSVADFSVLDYTGGCRDLDKRLIRVIGDPVQRYHEDPVRMLRAIRLAAKLHFRIERASEEALISLPQLLQHVPSARLFDEVLKLFFEGNAVASYEKLQQYDFLAALFPDTVRALAAEKRPVGKTLIQLAMQATDERLASDQSVNPGFLFSVLLWPVLQMALVRITNRQRKFFMQLHQAIHDVIAREVAVVMIPKRFQAVIQSVWLLQFYLERRRPKRVLNTLNHRYFRAALDFMGLRVEAGECDDKLFKWWTDFYAANNTCRQEMIDALRKQR